MLALAVATRLRSPDLSLVVSGELRSRYHFAARFLMGKETMLIAPTDSPGLSVLSDAGVEVVENRSKSPGTWHGRPLDAVVALEDLPPPVGEWKDVWRCVRKGGVGLYSSPRSGYSGALCANLGAEIASRELPISDSERHECEVFFQRARDAYRLAPFDDRDASEASRLRIYLWDLSLRLPLALKDRVTRLLFNRAFYPGEYDYKFTAFQPRSHRVVVVLRKT